MKTILNMRKAEGGARKASADPSAVLRLPSSVSRPPACGLRSPVSGFTLMEINAALVIVAVSLLGLLALFPVGLRQGAMATADTTQAAFADMVLNAMRANAQAVTNWNDWSKLAATPTPLLNNINNLVSPGNTPTADGVTTNIIDEYLVPGEHIEYVFGIQNGPAGNNDLVRVAWIRVSNRRYADIMKAPLYATAFAYMGM